MLLSGLSKKFALVMVFVFAVSVMFLVEPSTASVTMPSHPSPAPEIISVEVNHNPIWNPPTYTTNPYTGEVIETSSGSWTLRGTLDVVIKNRPFEPYTDKNGNHINVYYTFFWKRSSENLWRSDPIYVVYQSASGHTVISLTYGGYYQDLWVSWNEVRNFRVQAVIGYFGGGVFEGEGSEWTEFTVTIPGPDNPVTQTPSIPLTPNSPSISNPNNSPQQNPSLFDMVIVRVFVALCIIVVLMVATAFLFKQRKKSSTLTLDNEKVDKQHDIFSLKLACNFNFVLTYLMIV